MINLLAVSYSNIWPFKDQLLSIFFDEGKYLIKAPIGSGKSFLFFDGPIYGLYKYSNRNILNIQSKQGFIKLLFEVEGQNYLIIRHITKGKSKESCATTLYTVDKIEEFSQQTWWIINNLDIQEEIKKNHNIHIEEVTFKNETDLQQTLNTLLPPREVFLNTVFLMQDSDNIFELAPADRLTVLKNVFNLMWIDEAKDKIADRKKEIWYKLKATADTSKYDEKLKRLLADYMGRYKEVSWPLTKNFSSFFDELEMIYEKVNIAEFGVDNFPVQMHEDIDVVIEKTKSDYQKFLHQLQTIVENCKLESHKVEGYKKESKELISHSEQLKIKIAHIDPKKIGTLKEEKKSLQEEYVKLERGVKSLEITTFYENHISLFEDFKIHNEAISHAYFFVQYLKNKGKILNEEVKNIELQIKHKEFTIQEYTQQLKNLEDKVVLFDKDMDQQAAFDCSKIAAPCPFIKVINKKTFDQLEKQRELLNKEKIELREKIESINTPTPPKENVEQTINEIKDFLNEIDWKWIETMYDEAQVLQWKEKQIDNEITSLEAEISKLEEYTVQIGKNTLQIENIEKSIKETEIKIEAMKIEEGKIKHEGEKINYQTILALEKLNTKMKETYRDISSLVHEFKDVQIQIQQIKQEEEVMNNLYTIFSKELLLLVLQDHLPVLSDIINSYLAQVVEYQISFSLHKSSTDKLELLANIFDEKGERDVKSLSGGQRVILKIVWMLTISSYIHSPILFIDETINNLDADTVGKVSDMLEDFVKSRPMKLYAVTHNQQIQEMRFWDKVIELN